MYNIYMYFCTKEYWFTGHQSVVLEIRELEQQE
jgi:hypothetical protein